MKIEISDIGPHRWSMKVWPMNGEEASEFEVWMKSNYPECFFKKRHFNNSKADTHYHYYWEVRGTHYSFPTTLKLTWG
jgi:hypothetical protein